jgi:hypothetical protein
MLIIYQTNNFNIKEGAKSSKQKISDLPDYVGASTNIKLDKSPLNGDITKFYNKMPADKYAYFKRNNYTYTKLNDSYNNTFKVFDNNPVKLNNFLSLRDDTINWVVTYGTFLNGKQLLILSNLTSDEISKVIAGTNATQIKNILNENINIDQMLNITRNLIALPNNYYVKSTNLDYDCLSEFILLSQEHQKYALDNLTASKIKEVLLIPANYNVPIYMLYNKNESNSQLTNLIKTTTDKQKSLDANTKSYNQCSQNDLPFVTGEYNNCKSNLSNLEVTLDNYKSMYQKQVEILHKP